MLDELLPQIEQAQAEGAIVLLKWDGERPANRYTVVITRQSTDYSWRQDSDNMAASWRQGLSEYHLAHSH